MATSESYIYTNVDIFYKIAKESYDFIVNDMNNRTKVLKSSTSETKVVRIDMERKGFKNSFICIVFVGIWLESILHIAMVKKLGEHEANKYDKSIYEEKLNLLSILDNDLLSRVKEFRVNRNEIVHEKAYKNSNDIKFAQDEAIKAYALMEDIKSAIATQS